MTGGWRRGAAVAAVALAAACAGDAGGRSRDGEVVAVSAAASLAGVFEALASAFEVARPGTRVELNFASSSVLREQILAGAPIDVFASADLDSIDRLAAARRLAGEPSLFARGRLAMAVPRGNPGAVRGLDDLRREELFVGLCAEAAPCGIYAARLLRAADVEPSVDSREPNVRALLTKLEAGELDVGLVYATDVASSPVVEEVPLDPGTGVEAHYPIAVVADAKNRAAAEAFVEFATSAEGRAVLSAHGFAAP